MELLRTPDAAALLGCSQSKLNKARCSGTLRIPFVRIGRAIYYTKADVLAWLEQHRHLSTSEYDDRAAEREQTTR